MSASFRLSVYDTCVIKRLTGYYKAYLYIKKKKIAHVVAISMIMK